MVLRLSNSDDDIFLDDRMTKDKATPGDPSKTYEPTCSTSSTPTNDMFKETLNLSSFNPDELRVNVAGRRVVITEEHIEEDRGSHTSTRIGRIVQLPEHIKTDIILSGRFNPQMGHSASRKVHQSKRTI